MSCSVQEKTLGLLEPAVVTTFDKNDKKETNDVIEIQERNIVTAVAMSP